LVTETTPIQTNSVKMPRDKKMMCCPFTNAFIDG
jgi:hypothetical protein